MSKCKCGVEPDHHYKSKHLCKYHYWVERGRPKDENWGYIWKQYRYLHPVRVIRWRKMDANFDEYMKTLEVEYNENDIVEV